MTVWEEIDKMCREYGWEQADLSRVLGFSEANTSNLINGKLTMTIGLAKQLSEIFGMSPFEWIEKSPEYKGKHKTNPPKTRERRMMELYRMFSIRELAKKGWITCDNDADRIERDIIAIMGESSYQHATDIMASIDRGEYQKNTHTALDPNTVLWIKVVQSLDIPTTNNKLTMDKLRNASMCDYSSGVDTTIIKHGITPITVNATRKEPVSCLLYWKDNNPYMAFTHERKGVYAYEYAQAMDTIMRDAYELCMEYGSIDGGHMPTMLWMISQQKRRMLRGGDNSAVIVAMDRGCSPEANTVICKEVMRKGKIKRTKIRKQT